MLKTVNYALLILFIAASILARFFGLLTPPIQVGIIPNCTQSETASYFNYRKLCKQNYDEDVYGIIVKACNPVKIIKIYRKPIGEYIQNSEKFAIERFAIEKFAIDSSCNLFKQKQAFDANDRVLERSELDKGKSELTKLIHPKLIQVEGDYKQWGKYYKELEKNNLIKQVYSVKIYDDRIDLWLHPGVLVQLNGDIQNLAKAKAKFPELFQRGNLIDLRSPKKLGLVRNYFKAAIKTATQSKTLAG